MILLRLIRNLESQVFHPVKILKCVDGQTLVLLNLHIFVEIKHDQSNSVYKPNNRGQSNRHNKRILLAFFVEHQFCVKLFNGQIMIIDQSNSATQKMLLNVIGHSNTSMTIYYVIL